MKKAAQTLSTAPAPSQSKVWNLLGLAYHGARQFDAASEAYGRALKFDRNNVAADYNLGRLRLDQGNMQGAIDYLNTYVMLRPRDPVTATSVRELPIFITGLERTAWQARARFLEDARHDF